MIFKLHYWFTAAGINAIGYLLGVYIQTYTDASSLEIGALLMIMPFTSMIFKPIICSMADRSQAHKKYLMICIWVTCISYSPYVAIPLLGPQAYKVHPRICWYILLVSKVIGDISLGGVMSIGDSLAVNYAKRINTDFSVYRVWGTVSWMVFGIFIGYVNEVPFLPKYLPGFLILLITNLANVLVIWLWPDEYYRMVSLNSVNEELEETEGEEKKKTNKFTKSLMPREVVQAHMKAKILGLFKRKSRVEAGAQSRDGEVVKNSTNAGQLDLESHKTEIVQEQNKPSRISKGVQLKIFILLVRRDPRIVLYCLYFIVSGLISSPLSFFIISLSEICHGKGTCDFSVLAGLLQASMALAETFVYAYVGTLMKKIGRVNTCSLSLATMALKYLFYGLYFEQVDPNYALLAELLHGASFGLRLTITVEMGYRFSNEITYIIPELISKNIVEPGTDANSLELSLSATMQAVVSCVYDGLGRGVGALIIGLMLEQISYSSLWTIVGIGTTIALAICMSISLLDQIFKFNLGLEAKAAQEKRTKFVGIVTENKDSNKDDGLSVC